MFTWSTPPMSRTGQESRNIESGETQERTGKRIKDRRRGGNEGKQRGKKRRAGKTEEERSENVSKVREKNKRISCIEGVK